MSRDRILPEAYDALAPDGSEVRILASSERGSMSHFTLLPGQVSFAVFHLTVEEIWYILAGQGQMWRKSVVDESITELRTGLSLVIPVGTSFQFRSEGDTPLHAVGITMPPWPGMDEAVFVLGKW